MRLLLALVFAAGLSASPLLVSTSGTFSPTTPTTFTAWTLSFQVDSNPAVSNVNPGTSFNVSFSNFTYRVDGSPLFFFPPAAIPFFNASARGLFDVCLDNTRCAEPGPLFNVFEFDGEQAYTGPESSPTIQPGSYPSHFTQVFINGAQYIQANSTVTIASLTSAVPEPAAFSLLGIGVIALAAWRKRARLTGPQA